MAESTYSTWPPKNPLAYFNSKSFKKKVELLSDELSWRYSALGETAVFDSISRTILKVVANDLPPSRRLTLEQFESESDFISYLRKAATRRARKGERQEVIGKAKRLE